MALYPSIFRIVTIIGLTAMNNGGGETRPLTPPPLGFLKKEIYQIRY
jgi:hypothetical protein